MKRLFVLLALLIATPGAIAGTPANAVEARAATPCPLKAAQNKSPWDMHGTFTGVNSKSNGGSTITDKSI